jgi:hypothetical protein
MIGMFPTPKYRDRRLAAEFVTAQGIKVTTHGLADMAYRGHGPRYAIVRGRAVYTEAWLLEWIEEQISRPVTRRRRGDRQQSVA